MKPFKIRFIYNWETTQWDLAYPLASQYRWYRIIGNYRKNIGEFS